jgi:hypothetical protein
MLQALNVLLHSPEARKQLTWSESWLAQPAIGQQKSGAENPAFHATAFQANRVSGAAFPE